MRTIAYEDFAEQLNGQNEFLSILAHSTDNFYLCRRAISARWPEASVKRLRLIRIPYVPVEADSRFFFLISEF
jgi:hypothetical protein